MSKFLVFIILLVATNSFASANRILDGQVITNGAAVLTLPTSTDTMVGRSTTDTLLNKSLSGSSNTFTNIPTSAIAGSALSGSNSGDVTLGTANGLSIVGQVLSMGVASSGVTGALSGTDYTRFNAAASGPTITGTRASPTAVTAVGGVAFSGTQSNTHSYIAGSGGAVTVTANPQVAAGSSDGQILVLVGRSATNTVTLADGTGLSLNGSWVGGLDSTLVLRWDTVNWAEVNRR